jgi:hypothetical protein
MRLSVLLNRKLVSESGQQLGRVHDLRGELVEGRLMVTGLIAGKLGIPRALRRRHPRQRRPETAEGTRPPRHPLGAGRPRRAGDRHPRPSSRNQDYFALVLVVPPRPVLELVAASPWCPVEQLPGAVQHIGAPVVARVGVVDDPVFECECAQAV